MSLTLITDVREAQSWDRLNFHERQFLCRRANIDTRLDAWELIDSQERQLIREAAGALVGFASKIGGLI